jgi:hypothetical protein
MVVAYFLLLYRSCYFGKFSMHPQHKVHINLMRFSPVIYKIEENERQFLDAKIENELDEHFT